MTAAPVIRAASAGASRRLVQTAVIFVVLTAATAAALLGLTLTTSADELFQNAFTKQHGADLALIINMAKVTSRELAATRHVPGATKSGRTVPRGPRHPLGGGPFRCARQPFAGCGPEHSGERGWPGVAVRPA